MPRNVRCALIQASNAISTDRPLAQIRKAMVDKHLKLIEQAAKKKAQILCLQELFNGPYFCAEQNARWYEMTEHVPDKAMYLILNTAVGGDWAGAPDRTTAFPQYFTIDYVRIYQHHR